MNDSLNESAHDNEVRLFPLSNIDDRCVRRTAGRGWGGDDDSRPYISLRLHYMVTEAVIDKRSVDRK